MFSTVTDEALSNSHLNDDLSKINDWAYKSKMKFFSVEIKNVHYPPITYNNFPVKPVQFQKHLGLTLNLKLNFNEHI